MMEKGEKRVVDCYLNGSKTKEWHTAAMMADWCNHIQEGGGQWRTGAMMAGSGGLLL